MSVKSITMTVFDRPDYLERTLAALSRNNLSGYTLHLGVEPGNAEVLRICRNIRFIETCVVVNETRLGVNKNTVDLIDRAFAAGSRFNVHLEDDEVLAPDALDMADWFFSLERMEDYEALCFDYQDSFDVLSGPRDVVFDQALTENYSFASRAFCFTRTKWETEFRELARRSLSQPIFTWDYWIHLESQKKPGSRLLMPALSRVAHIGVRSDVHPGWLSWAVYGLILWRQRIATSKEAGAYRLVRVPSYRGFWERNVAVLRLRWGTRDPNVQS